MKVKFLSLILLLVGTSVSADNRLHDFTHVQVVEQNIVLDKKDPQRKEIRINQLVAYKNMYDSELQGLVCVGWTYTGELQGIYHIGGSSYLVELRNGALVLADMLYQSVTPYDVEQANRAIYRYYNDSSMLMPKFQRRAFFWRSFVIPPSEEDPADIVEDLIQHI